MMEQYVKLINVMDLVSKTNDGSLLSDITLQREIVYDSQKQEKVIDSIINGIGIPSIMLWEIQDGIYEVIDGKQRIHSIKNFINNNLTYDSKTFYQWGVDNKSQQEKFKQYQIIAQVFRGSEQQKRETFYRINTSAIPLSHFEIINSLVNNEYMNELNHFVNANKDLSKIFNDTNTRGKYQYEILKILSKQSNPIKIAEYMNQQTSFEKDKKLILKYMRFILDIFIKINNKYLDLSLLWKLSIKYGDMRSQLLKNQIEIHHRIKEFYKDKTLLKLIDNKQKELYFEELLSINELQSLDKNRFFSLNDKQVLFDQNKKIVHDITVSHCNSCKNTFRIDYLEVDHIIPWSLGGKTSLDNAQLLCKSCNAKKSNKI